MVKICLIDDDQNILASLSLALKSEKFDVKTYSDGISGLEALEKDNFDRTQTAQAISFRKSIPSVPF